MNTKRHEKELTFIEHLEELRLRIIYGVIALVVCTCIGFAFANPVLMFLTKPFKVTFPKSDKNVLRIVAQPDGSLKLATPLSDSTSGGDAPDLDNISRVIIEVPVNDTGDKREIVVGENFKNQFYYFGPIDPFILRLKAAMLLGILLSLPLLVWQIWMFIRPALQPPERKAILPVTISASLLFPIGAAFAYYFTRYALLFLGRYTFPGLEPRIDIFKYLNFLLTMMLALGIVFETPLVIMLLARVGIVNSRMLARFRSQIYVGIFVVAAFLTPPDAFTMLALGIPLVLLFEVSLLLIKPIERRRSANHPEPV